MSNPGRAHFEVVESAVRGLSKVQTYIEHGMNDVIEVSLDLAENGGDNEDSLHDLEAMMKEYIALDADLQQFNEAVGSVMQQMRQCDPKEDFDVQSELKMQSEEMAVHSSDADEHEKMVELREKLWQLQHPGEAGIPKQEVASQDEDEDEPTLTQMEVSTRCPISQGEMVDPVKNQICGHSYERKAVVELMKQKRGTKCPVTGCNNRQPILQKHLLENKELKMAIDRNRRQAGKKGN